MIKLTPLDSNTPQDALAKRLAHLLADEGVEDTAALPVAITIMAGIQRAIDANDLAAAIVYWDEDKRTSEDWWLRVHPKSRTAKAIQKRRKDKAQFSQWLSELLPPVDVEVQP